MPSSSIPYTSAMQNASYLSKTVSSWCIKCNRKMLMPKQLLEVVYEAASAIIRMREGHFDIKSVNNKG